MKSLPKSKLDQVVVGSNMLRITHLAHRRSYLVITCPNLHENQKLLLGKSAPIWVYLIWHQYIILPIVSFIYLYFPLFGFIYPYL